MCGHLGEGEIVVVATNGYGMTSQPAYSETITISEFDESSVSADDVTNMISSQSSKLMILQLRYSISIFCSMWVVGEPKDS